MRFRHVRTASLLALLTASCSLGDPADAGSLNLFVTVDPATLPVGESMTITVTARNVGFDPISLSGPTACLLYVEILSNQGQIQWSSNQAQICGNETSSIQLAAGEEISRTFTWQGVNFANGRLAAGFYHIQPIARVTPSPYVGPPVSVALE